MLLGDLKQGSRRDVEEDKYSIHRKLKRKIVQISPKQFFFSFEIIIDSQEIPKNV